MIELNKIYNESNLDTLKRIPSHFIDLTLTSPPYDNGVRTYKGNFTWNHEIFCQVADELFRVTKKGGVVVWVVNDATVNGSESGTSFRQALYFKEAGFNLYDTMIYAKQNPPPKNHPRYEQAFEYMFILSKGKPKTFNPILEPCSNAGRLSLGTMRNNSGDDLCVKHGIGKPIKETKIKSNIWYYTVGSNHKENFIHKHPAIMPEKLAEDVINS